MPTAQTLFHRLLKVALPTLAQGLGSFFLALLLLFIAQSQAILDRLGITQAAIHSAGGQLHDRFELLLHSPVTANLALMTFWATIGLIAYIICWGGYNILIEARNELTLNTSYVNRGHWRGAPETLALKAVAAVGLAVVVGTIAYGLSLYLALASRFLTQLDPISSLQALAAVCGLALHLYLILVFVQLTITPWYRYEA